MIMVELTDNNVKFFRSEVFPPSMRESFIVEILVQMEHKLFIGLVVILREEEVYYQ